MENKNNQPESVTIRDYFAAKAMQALVTAAAANNFAGTNLRLIANDAYQIADAMIEQRDNKAV